MEATQRPFYGKAMEDADTSCNTRKGCSPRGNVYLPRQRCTVKGTCGPKAQQVQKQHSELEVTLVVYFKIMSQKDQFISF